jgi:hypothetical protein
VKVEGEGVEEIEGHTEGHKREVGGIGLVERPRRAFVRVVRGTLEQVRQSRRWRSWRDERTGGLMIQF